MKMAEVVGTEKGYQQFKQSPEQTQPGDGYLDRANRGHHFRLSLSPRRSRRFTSRDKSIRDIALPLQFLGRCPISGASCPPLDGA